MNSSQLASFQQFWSKQWSQMMDRQYEERTEYKNEVDEEKEKVREAARLRIEHIRSGTTALVGVDNEILKIREGCDSTLDLIEKQHNERMQLLVEIQRKEQAEYEKSHTEAKAARSALRGILTTTMIIDPVALYLGRTTPATSRGSETRSRSPGRPGLPNEGTLTAISAPREQDPPVKRGPSLDTPIESVPTPDFIMPAVDGEINVSRTITFEEVYQQGLAEHKDTIFEFPSGKNEWYILKCEKHHIHFTRHPLQGAAKHINGSEHGHLDKSYNTTISTLGYRVIGCTAQLANLNNKVVDEAYAKGYMPYNGRIHDKKPKKVQRATTQRAKKGASHSTKKPKTARRASLPGTITNPKNFHIYCCLWKGRTYPVMILSWDNLEPGGLATLACTGLLHEASQPPSCYRYKTADNGTKVAIIGWSSGYHEGASKISLRKFPAMFFDPDQEVGWIPAKSLSKFPLYDPHPSKIDIDSFHRARRWIAKNNGFETWEAFELAQKEAVSKDKDNITKVEKPLLQPEVDDSDDSTDSESSVDSSDSHVTEKELLAMRDRAGEIAGDSDYAASNNGNLEAGADDQWGLDEAGERPWAFYALREKAQAKPQKTAEKTIVLPMNSASPIRPTEADVGVLTGPLGNPSLPPTGPEVISKGIKRARAEGQTGTNDSLAGETGTKKAKTGETTGDNAARLASELMPATPELSPSPLFQPKTPLGPVAFELSSYSSGLVSWSRESEEQSVKLYYGENNAMVGTVDGLVQIIIDPCGLRALTREEIPNSKGNSMVTLLNKDDTSTKLVLDRARGSRVDIGKVQVRSLIRWLKGINPDIRLI